MKVLPVGAGLGAPSGFQAIDTYLEYQSLVIIPRVWVHLFYLLSGELAHSRGVCLPKVARYLGFPTGSFQGSPSLPRVFLTQLPVTLLTVRK